jgi:4'-phosphopantetheinyl transferase
MNPIWKQPEATVYSVNLEQHLSEIEFFESVLSTEEIERAWRYGTNQLRDQFVVRRGLLRVLLSQHLNCRPTAIELSTTRHGKLQVVGTPLQINVSASRDIALYAVSPYNPVGVDIEWLDSTLPISDGVLNYLGSADKQRISRLPHRNQSEEFLRCWVRMEAKMKAIGLGLVESPAPIEGLTIHDLPVPEGYVGAMGWLG